MPDGPHAQFPPKPARPIRSMGGETDARYDLESERGRSGSAGTELKGTFARTAISIVLMPVVQHIVHLVAMPEGHAAPVVVVYMGESKRFPSR